MPTDTNTCRLCGRLPDVDTGPQLLCYRCRCSRIEPDGGQCTLAAAGGELCPTHATDEVIVELLAGSR